MTASPPLTIDALERWVDFGAKLRVVELDGGHAVVELCQCTGELVERRDTTDPEVIEYLRTAPAGERLDGD